METGREVMRRGKREDLRAVWGNTGVKWWVGEEDIWKRAGEEEGWERIMEMTRKRKRKSEGRRGAGKKSRR